MKSFFTPKEVCRITGATYRQLGYWDETKFIQPSCRRHKKYRLYTFSDLIQLWIALALKGNRCPRRYSVQKLRGLMNGLKTVLRMISWPLGETTFLVDNNRIVAFNEAVMSSNCNDHYKLFSVENLRQKINAVAPEKQPLRRAHRRRTNALVSA